MSKKKLLADQIMKAAKEGQITCSLLRSIAEKTESSYKLAGKAADELKVKIRKCDLGCF